MASVPASDRKKRHYQSSAVVKRSINLARHKTSVSLENQFWEALREIALKRNIPTAVLIEQIDNNRTGSNLSSAIRLFVLNYFKTVGRLSPSNTTPDLNASEPRPR
jgi:predicted DNA-binding ribbon-helix-helix protein